GAYEVFAQMAGLSGFIEISLGGNSQGGSVQLLPPPQVYFDVRRPGAGAAALNVPMTLIARRTDLSDADPPREIKLPAQVGVALAPGHWEFSARIPAGYYLDSIVNTRQFGRAVRTDRAADWFEATIEARAPAQFRVSVSDQPAQIGGAVSADGKTVAGVP